LKYFKPTVEEVAVVVLYGVKFSCYYATAFTLYQRSQNVLEPGPNPRFISGRGPWKSSYDV